MIYTVIVYCGLGPILGLVVGKRLASLGIGSSEARWSSSSQNISEVKGYSDWDCNGFTGTQVTNVSHSGLSLGGILEGYSDSPRLTSETSKVKGEELDVK